MNATPDAVSRGLLQEAPEPARYGGGCGDDPHEVPAILRGFMPERSAVLDVGIGVGAVTEFINAGRHNAVFCIEPDPIRAAMAQGRGLKVYQGLFDQQFLNQPEASERFDVIVFGDVLEHLPSPAEALDLALRCLKSGGLILASTPNVAHWTVRLGLLFGRFNYAESGIMDATHLRWFTEATLSRLFAQQGFQVERLRYTAGLWLPHYSRGLLKFIPYRIKRVAVLILLRLFPRLMAAQLVVAARPRAGNPSGQ
jgi:2-polyprenyl-3-methyl-5-hydroxy-6-metoxy-1,4-benzoquinol methylase